MEANKIDITRKLISPQIREGCRLALPEGLQDLMCDISREVLRAQPQDLYQFIADYLSALMVARENLSIAARLCDTVCTSGCNPELEDELRFIGLDDADINKAKKIIETHFAKGKVDERSLMIKIATKTNIDESLLSAVQEAVRRAFQRNLVNNKTIYESSSGSDLDEIAYAAKHTLHLYRRTPHTPEEYTRAATRIQAAYRAYGVKRQFDHQTQEPSLHRKNKPVRKTRFSAEVHPDEAARDLPKACMPSISSSSLAGSYLNLPRFYPYSVHEPQLPEYSEESERENASVFYVNEEFASSSGHKKISFQDHSQDVEDKAILADAESDASIEEVIAKADDDQDPDDGGEGNCDDCEDLI